jgi:hypothetical protein
MNRNSSHAGELCNRPIKTMQQQNQGSSVGQQAFGTARHSSSNSAIATTNNALSTINESSGNVSKGTVRQETESSKVHSFFSNSHNGRRRSDPIHRHEYKPGPVPLNPDTSETWIYPQHDDYPTRQYQLEITETALNFNTLVSLPTGLGKTHIAAVVMYNFFRWFAPQGKIMFLAPTLPLVNQQVKACYGIVGIPPSDTAVMTGKMNPGERLEYWKRRNVFYCTPQSTY